MSISRRVAVAFLLFGAGAASSSQPRQSGLPEQAGVRRCAERQMEASHFSGIVSLAYRNRPAWTLTSGRMAGPERGPIAADTRFNLGSASKMFTAIAVAQLLDGGKVHLDDAVGRYVAGLDQDASRVTVRQLLTHTSGLGDFFRPENMETMLRARTASDILPLIRNEKPAFAPGSRFSYSNSGFALLGILIERVSGQPYGDYLRRHIFLPAGMTATGLDPRPLGTLAVTMTRGPRPQMGGSASPDHPPKMILIGPEGGHAQPPLAADALRPAPGATEGYGSPAGGLFSTAGDMQKFMAALLANRLARAETTAAMIAPQVEVAPASGDQPARHYGYGFGVGTFEGHRWVGHNGGTLGANTEVVSFPDDQWSLVVLSNRDPPEATELLHRLRNLMFHPDLVKTCGA